MTALREATLRRAGLDPDSIPYQTAEIAEQRDLSHWLPLALASIHGLVATAYGSKNPPKLTDTLRLWGLRADADRLDAIARTGREATTDRALTAFFNK